ncbi:MAG: hypothetical protein EWV85_11115 [Microcystis aeruginosa Ma_QC_C_20070703_M131]|uniref:Uncharacterized protein n=1 Tax=Microcystis aeruginosa Ma_QC_C_20070703_M131 TaxID=2486263 RepID=A0A551Y0Q5_MICAE|nr:MAG: hypothetical protein EWV85_11115 [Microcystis aeruginosa Ma_QC_C_20070703_M131]
MRNVNLNILKFVESINNFCLSLSNIGLGDSYQLSVISYQLSVISYQLSVIRCEFWLFWFLCGNEVYTDSLFNKIFLKVFPSKHFTIS